MKTKNIIIIALTLLLFGGCSMLNKWNEKNCSQTNWSQYGYSEGSAGKPNSGSSISQKCSKAGIQIDMNGYNKGYGDGIAKFCSYNAGKSNGAANQPTARVCQSSDTYMKGYEAGTKLFCSSNKGYDHGYSNLEPLRKCQNYSVYSKAFSTGQRKYCSGDRAFDQAVAGEKQIDRCMKFSEYSRGYAKGEAHFCSEDNGNRLGADGKPFPEKCERAGRAFERAFNSGRVTYLEPLLREKEADIADEKRDYEGLRDELSDLQFEVGRLPRYSGSDSSLDSKRSSLNSQIDRIRDERNRRKAKIDELGRDILDIKSEISRLR